MCETIATRLAKARSIIDRLKDKIQDPELKEEAYQWLDGESYVIAYPGYDDRDDE